MRRVAKPPTSNSIRLITTKPQRLMVGTTNGRPETVTTVVKVGGTPRPRAGVGAVAVHSSVSSKVSISGGVPLNVISKSGGISSPVGSAAAVITPPLLSLSVHETSSGSVPAFESSQ